MLKKLNKRTQIFSRYLQISLPFLKKWGVWINLGFLLARVFFLPPRKTKNNSKLIIINQNRQWWWILVANLFHSESWAVEIWLWLLMVGGAYLTFGKKKACYLSTLLYITFQPHFYPPYFPSSKPPYYNVMISSIANINLLFALCSKYLMVGLKGHLCAIIPSDCMTLAIDEAIFHLSHSTSVTTVESWSWWILLHRLTNVNPHLQYVFI